MTGADVAGWPHVRSRPGAIACVVLWIAVFAPPMWSCRRGASTAHPPAHAQSRPRLVSVQVEDASLDAENSGPVDVAPVASTLEAMLLESKLVDAAVADAATSATGTLRIGARVGFEFVEVETKGIVRAGVTIRLSTRPSDSPGAINDELSAAGERRYDVHPELDRRRLGQALVERTAADLMSGYVARARLTVATPEEIHAAIAGDGGALRSEAVRVAGARGLRQEIPTLLPLLNHDEETLRDASLGALIALKERRAVTELTRNRSLRDRHEMRKILEAISILGGEEARDYLSFVADSHDDDEIRKLAAEAKGRLDRRAPATAK